MDSRASGQKLADLSRLVKGRSPIMWQMEFTDQVTWCWKDRSAAGVWP